MLIRLRLKSGKIFRKALWPGRQKRALLQRFHSQPFCPRLSITTLARESQHMDMEDDTKAPESLGDRMKSYEASTVMKLDPNLPFIIRIDGS
jgi:hypothetical protein